ncbi:hypothetical protein AVEN_25458-1 [Araneus ventricosus]|uniref:Uncharacterized protein n=1 Tax=Araneus ventricosus TaxID=182803 RepID=A0A4Y2C112_ARAVE|nr:hypothetical protein AVEN_25458-1 [Araneus ventricosus]
MDFIEVQRAIIATTKVGSCGHPCFIIMSMLAKIPCRGNVTFRAMDAMKGWPLKEVSLYLEDDKKLQVFILKNTLLALILDVAELRSFFKDVVIASASVSNPSTAITVAILPKLSRFHQ